jgi:hypothetical protein
MRTRQILSDGWHVREVQAEGLDIAAPTREMDWREAAVGIRPIRPILSEPATGEKRFAFEVNGRRIVYPICGRLGRRRREPTAHRRERGASAWPGLCGPQGKEGVGEP